MKLWPKCDKNGLKFAQMSLSQFFSDKGLKLWLIVTKKGLSQFPQKNCAQHFQIVTNLSFLSQIVTIWAACSLSLPFFTAEKIRGETDNWFQIYRKRHLWSKVYRLDIFGFRCRCFKRNFLFPRFSRLLGQLTLLLLPGERVRARENEEKPPSSLPIFSPIRGFSLL